MDGKMYVFSFGIVLLTIQQCFAYDDNYNYDYEEPGMSVGTIIGIVIGSTFIFVLKVWCCYRFIYHRRITLVHVPVVVRDRNPHHAGYDQDNSHQVTVQQTVTTRPQQPPPYQPPSKNVQGVTVQQ
ncbi:hypothetical protein ACF0H5_015877 [Mactra antiquata]